MQDESLKYHPISAASTNSALLALMRPLPKPARIAVLSWLRCEFGTSMVMELEPRELHQTRQHVLNARRAAGI